MCTPADLQQSYPAETIFVPNKCVASSKHIQPIPRPIAVLPNMSKGTLHKKAHPRFYGKHRGVEDVEAQKQVLPWNSACSKRMPKPSIELCTLLKFISCWSLLATRTNTGSHVICIPCPDFCIDHVNDHLSCL